MNRHFKNSNNFLTVNLLIFKSLLTWLSFLPISRKTCDPILVLSEDYLRKISCKMSQSVAIVLQFLLELSSCETDDTLNERQPPIPPKLTFFQQLHTYCNYEDKVHLVTMRKKTYLQQSVNLPEETLVCLHHRRTIEKQDSRCSSPFSDRNSN